MFAAELCLSWPNYGVAVFCSRAEDALSFLSGVSLLLPNVLPLKKLIFSFSLRTMFSSLSFSLTYVDWPDLRESLFKSNGADATIRSSSHLPGIASTTRAYSFCPLKSPVESMFNLKRSISLTALKEVAVTDLL